MTPYEAARAALTAAVHRVDVVLYRARHGVYVDAEQAQEEYRAAVSERDAAELIAAEAFILAGGAL